MQTIVVPLDGSPLARAALPHAATLARATGSRLLLVRAVLSFARLGQDPDLVRAEALGEARAALEALARELRADGLPAEARVLWADAASTILEVARQVGAPQPGRARPRPLRPGAGPSRGRRRRRDGRRGADAAHAAARGHPRDRPGGV